MSIELTRRSNRERKGETKLNESLVFSIGWADRVDAIDAGAAQVQEPTKDTD